MVTVPTIKPSICSGLRPSVRGKFLCIGEEKFYVRGVTYGPFRLDRDGDPYPAPKVVEKDFAQMAANGVNAIRTYNTPPRWLLDMAQGQGLRVMVGLQGERHFAFLDDPQVVQDIKERVRAGIRSCAGHPAVLCYTLANEIPAHIVRWHGARRVEQFLEELFCVAKTEDPQGFFSYANYPTTEYLDLSFLDLVCFNVYLESQPRYEAYLARLQNLAGNRPLIMTEIGLDSRRNGEEAQAESLDWQIRTAFGGGCAGAFVFAWTDEWHTGGREIEDWDFGLTDRARRPKAALAAVRKTLAEVPFPADIAWPRVSVVVCTYNGSRTVRQCLEGLQKLHYPDYEVIVVDDGSTDGTAGIALEFCVRLIRTENRGLSAARNLGLEAATGQIVAYIDDDTCPDPDWLSYLAASFQNTDCAGVGGPNIPFPNDGEVAICIANAPGGPTHVLLSDREAEHIPGCNMAFRKDWLQAIGGFDAQFRVAGDDVDVCWRVRDSGGWLAFSPGAMVWHHCRNSVCAFWKQQVGYGKAEAMLEKKWPGKYNPVGQIAWAGRIYSDGLLRARQRGRGRIYQGTWGTASYSRLYQPRPGVLNSLSVSPEWPLVNLAVVGLAAIGYLWKPLLVALPLLLSIAFLPFISVFLRVSGARFSPRPSTRLARIRFQTFAAFLHLLHPAARLWGHLSYGLTPWRSTGRAGLLFPRRRSFRLWSEQGQAPVERLEAIESTIRASGAVVRRGGDYDDWDFEVSGGVFGNVRIRLVTEEHGEGKQFVHLRSSPKLSAPVFSLEILFVVLSAAAASNHAPAAAGLLGIFAVALGALTYRGVAAASGAVRCSLMKLGFNEAR